jgi:hypothetical protein
VTVDPAGGPLGVEVVIGNAQPGSYRLYLWDKGHRRYREFGAGVSTDNVPDTVTVPGTPRTLAGRVVEWNVLVSAGRGERLDVVVRLLQGGAALPEGTFHYTGALEKPSEVIADLVRLVAAPA